jgi:hypothetical protein
LSNREDSAETGTALFLIDPLSRHRGGVGMTAKVRLNILNQPPLDLDHDHSAKEEP